jgi:hypothetical protein
LTVPLGWYLRAALQREPVSPELVLVDPELARVERTRLEEAAQLRALHDVAPLRRAVQTESPPTEERLRRRPGLREAAAFSRRRLVPAALMCSLLGNGFLAAELLSRADDDAAVPVAVRMVTLTESAAAAPRISTAATVRTGVTTTARKQNRKLSATSAAVERKLVSLIVAAPARTLPSRFVNRTTGLVKNNVQVVCRRGTTRSFLCVVRLHTDKPKAGIYVRYSTSRNGKDVFRWYGYRRG